MGLRESTGNESCPPVQPEVNTMRKNYLQNLGIHKDKKPSFNRPTDVSMEAPGRLISAPEEEPDPPRGRISQGSRSSTSSVPGGNESLDSPGGADKEGDSGYPASGSKFEMNFLDLKSQDDFRVAFLRKLSYQKVWVPQAQREPQHQTVVIFDWDDTLLPTSWLHLRQEETQPTAVKRQLQAIEKVGIKLIELALELGHVFIITNAMSGWVEYSASKYIPNILPVIQRVHVISARAYEAQFPGNYSQWKIQAFLEVQRTLNSQIITNLISLGDSNFEMDAVHVMGREFEQALVKTIKFKESPTPEELVKQLDLVAQKFKKIVMNARNLKIGLERKSVGPSAQPGQLPQSRNSVSAASAAGSLSTVPTSGKGSAS